MSIAEDNIEKYLKYIEIPPNPSYIAGFIDGDGSISILKNNDSFNARISISQCRTNILSIVSHHFGGFVKLSNDEIGKKRTQYTYINRGDNLKFLVNYIKDYILIKKVQIDKLFEFLPLINKCCCSEIKEKICDIVLNANKIKIPIEINYNKLNDYYLAGFFDAEGCISIGKRKNGKFTKGPRVKITQKNNPNILTAIKDYLGYGKVDCFCWVFFGNKDNICYDFISRILEHSIVKYNQLIQLRKYLDSQVESTIIGFCDKINEERRIIYQSIFEEKHKSENIHEKLKGNIIEFNYKNFGYPLKKLQESNKKDITKKFKNSEKFIKINIKKELSEEHCKKISDSTFGKHRSITDDKIREIISEKNSGLTQNEIAEKYLISRSLVQTIFSGRLVPIDEINKRNEYIQNKTIKADRIKKLIELGYSEKESATISCAITNRDIEGKYMVNIWYFGKLRINKVKSLIKLPFTNTAPKLSIYIYKKLGLKVSESMIKNIWNRKTKLYKIDFEEEFPITFQNYIDDLIQENPTNFNLFEILN